MARTLQWRTLMVAVSAADASCRPLVRKGLDLATRFGASLRLLHIVAPGYAFVPDDLQQVTSELRALVGSRSTDVDVTTTVVRDYPIADAIVRQVLKDKPDVLVAESHRHGKVSRMLMNQTDWELIRHCPCPLWLSKSDRLFRDLKVLAAIDPFHSRAKPTRLDDIIMRSALNVAAGNRDHIIACHAYTPPASIMPALTGELYWQPLSEKELQRYEARTRKSVDRRMAKYQIPPRNRLTVPGDPASALVHAAKKYHVDVIVMGAVSRSALKRFFIGNTSERVIDEVECDLLVVKPADFRTPVPRRRTSIVVGYPSAVRAAPELTRHVHHP